ncbi:MAG: hypothetical protein JWR50_720 [Mucilaginibacter sp.]|nr:hypothetical protein [Mucilaginibacter sp.]
MKNIRLWLVMLVVSCILFACSSNGSTSAGNGGTSNATSDNSGGGSAKGNASFSYTIDGKTFSGNGTDNTANCAFKKSNNIVYFVLMSVDPSEKNPPQFEFSVADKGTTTITMDDIDRHSSGNNVAYFANFSLSLPVKSEIPNYNFHSGITVVITASNSSRFTGTFSGDLVDPDTKKVVQLNDGKFDLPFAPPSR